MARLAGLSKPSDHMAGTKHEKDAMPQADPPKRRRRRDMRRKFRETNHDRNPPGSSSDSRPPSSGFLLCVREAGGVEWNRAKHRIRGFRGLPSSKVACGSRDCKLPAIFKCLGHLIFCRNGFGSDHEELDVRTQGELEEMVKNFHDAKLRQVAVEIKAQDGILVLE